MDYFPRKSLSKYLTDTIDFLQKSKLGYHERRTEKSTWNHYRKEQNQHWSKQHVVHL